MLGGDTFSGVKIVTSLLMVEDGEPYEVKRTLRERIFSLPWRPLQSKRRIVPKVPIRDAMRLHDGTLVMHPDIAKELMRVIEK